MPSVVWTSKDEGTVKWNIWLSAIINPLSLSNIKAMGVVCDVIINLTTEVICITVFPRFLKNYPMILVQELPMTTGCCLHWLFVCIGKWLYSQAMILTRSCRWMKPCLYTCRWVLPLHYHPQLYITYYLVVKVSMLIWKVETKRNNNRKFPILLV